MVHVGDGSAYGTRGLTEYDVETLQELLADLRTWDGGIRQFIIDEQCDFEMIERIMAEKGPLPKHLRLNKKCARCTLTL